MKTKTKFAALMAILSIGLSTPALAHPKLVSSTPAASATVGATNRLTLTFSERLMPRLSGVDLAMTGMPGMANHAPMKIGGATTAVGERSEEHTSELQSLMRISYAVLCLKKK